jgi:uncharacterized paraquat-inducible protein A
MPICPTCGSTTCSCEALIASWIEAAPAGPSSSGSETACSACGYSGEMTDDDWGTQCPACGVFLRGGRADVTLRVTQLVDCPECGRQIGVTAEDQGKTVVCPGCSYFLGTPSVKPKAGRGR